jgi:formamidopyrimidine-DNA glycosylase
MPEGPETLQQIDFIKSQFKHPLREYYLAQVANLTTRFKFDVNLFTPALDKEIVNITCKGKFYFLHLGGDVSVMCHHGMKGYWTTAQETHSHVEFAFIRRLPDGEDDEHNVVLLYFTNVRLGDFQVFHDQEAKVAELKAAIAPGFIGDEQISVETFIFNLKEFTPRKRLRDILFDQHKLCSGLGNYLIAEIMYEMRLHPTAKLGDLDGAAKVRLFEVCRAITVQFYERRREKLVYKREVDPEGRPVAQMMVGSRTAHWVPEVQTIGA